MGCDKLREGSRARQAFSSLHPPQKKPFCVTLSSYLYPPFVNRGNVYMQLLLQEAIALIPRPTPPSSRASVFIAQNLEVWLEKRRPWSPLASIGEGLGALSASI